MSLILLFKNHTYQKHWSTVCSRLVLFMPNTMPKVRNTFGGCVRRQLSAGFLVKWQWNQDLGSMLMR